jgi:hypothetical protein
MPPPLKQFVDPANTAASSSLSDETPDTSRARGPQTEKWMNCCGRGRRRQSRLPNLVEDGYDGGKASMKHPVLDRTADKQVSLEDCLEAKLKWHKTGDDPEFLWRAEVGGGTWTVRVNDFPNEHLYTLFVNGNELGSFDEWPPRWEHRT